MRKKCYDVFVIGGGPIGIYTAYQLANRGFKVCLAEKKRSIGDGVICAGVVSKQVFENHNLPAESILSRIDSFVFVSPSGEKLGYIHPDIFAYVINRKIFDQGLARLARRFGVSFKLSSFIKKIEEDGRYYKIYTDRNFHYTRAVVIATGVNYQLQEKIGMGKPNSFFEGAQIELSLSTNPSTIEIHLGQKFAPGSFGWIAPIDRNYARVGVLVEKNGKDYLLNMLTERIGLLNSDIKLGQLKTKPIAYGPIKRSVRGRVIAVGEAAGQVKTTTGGGISYGLLCSEIAADRLSRVLKNGSGLVDYEMLWRSALQSEFDIGMEVRRIAQRLSDETIEKLFQFVKKNRFWVKLLLPKINFDFHSDMLSYCLKSFNIVLKHP